jgi:PAS domain S-box-containing protein
VDHIDAMVAFWDKDQRCVFANNAYREWFGKTREEMLGTRLQDLLGPLYKKNLPYIAAAYAGRKQVFEREIPTPDGTSIRYSLATYTPYIVDGEVQGIFVHVADVTPLKKLEAELRASKAHRIISPRTTSLRVFPIEPRFGSRSRGC